MQCCVPPVNAYRRTPPQHTSRLLSVSYPCVSIILCSIYWRFSFSRTPCQYVSKLDSAYIFFERIDPTAHVQGQWLRHLAFKHRLTAYNLACNWGLGRGGTLISTSATTHHPRHPILSHTIPYRPMSLGSLPLWTLHNVCGIFWERRLTFCIDFHHNPQMGNPSGVCIPCIHFDRLTGWCTLS